MNKKTLTLGITLFSMFFGAGNLIFAPWMGVQSSGMWPIALAGFTLTAVILPISAILIITPYGSAAAMLQRFTKPFASVFMIIVYLLIGPCIALPRTASTSYEMWSWLIGNGSTAKVLYAIVFFGTAAWMALHPGKLNQILGKILGPLLLLLIAMLCLPILFQVPAFGNVDLSWAQGTFQRGFTEGYQTMDLLAAFCFSIVFALNVKNLHPENEKKTLITSAILAGVLLALIYTLLCMCAATHSKLFQDAQNGAQILSEMARISWSSFGQILCGLIFLLACCNVCAGLLASCSEYFYTLVPSISYRIWLAGFAIISLLLSCLGLDSILSWSAALLGWICPLAIVLLVICLIWRKKPEELTDNKEGSQKTAS